MEKEPLCCCEYFDIHSERNHLLACCCNCVEFDEGFDRLVSGKQVPQSTLVSIMVAFQDRVRCPWPGGARQVPLDILLPTLMIPSLMASASLSLINTIFIFALLILILFIMKGVLAQRKLLFITWTIISFLLIYIIFEIWVIPLLEILLSENLAVNLLALIALACLYRMKIKTFRISKRLEVECGEWEQNRSQECPYCQVYIPERDYHCLWLNCCIGQHNRCSYLLFLITTIAALLYSSNLTLTTICHPFIFYKSILMPDDCSEVYEDFELSMSFVSAIYSLLIAVYLLKQLLHQVLLISLGFTGQEWNTLSPCQKLCCGICAKRPHSRGIFFNWKKLFCS